MRLIRDGSPGLPPRLSHRLSHSFRARLSSFTQLRSSTLLSHSSGSAALFFHTAPEARLSSFTQLRKLDPLLSHSSGARLSSFTQFRKLDSLLSHSSGVRLSASFTHLRKLDPLLSHSSGARLSSFAQLRSSTLFFHTAPELWRFWQQGE